MSDRFKAIRERIDGASAGPWRALQGMNSTPSGWRESLCLTNDTHFICWFDPHMTPDDRVFVVHARADVEWLHDELCEARAHLRALLYDADEAAVDAARAYLNKAEDGTDGS